MSMHLAQVNVAPMRYTMFDNRNDRFVRAFDRVNGAAEAAPGFIWRWTGGYNEVSEQIFGMNMLVNISVWSDIDALSNFVYHNPVHMAIMAQKEKWFHPVTEPNIALWWVDAGHRPSLQEAKERLDTLKTKGPSMEAFTFAQSFSADARDEP